MDKTLLHLLIIGEAAEDGEAQTRMFRQSRYLLKAQRVADKSGLQNALAKGSWDVLVARNNLPHLAVDMAFEVLRKAGQDIPFIVFADHMEGNEAVRLMNLGVHDVVPTAEPARLLAVVSRELAAAEMRRAAQANERGRNEIELKLKILSDSVADAICYSQDGMHIETNSSYLRLFGYGALEELEGIPVLNLVAAADQARIKECFRRASRGEDAPQAFTGVRKDGSAFPAEMRIRTIQLRGEPCQQIAVYDRPAQSAAEPVIVKDRDPLTGLLTREGFLAAAAEADKGVSLLYVNVRDLRSLNQRSGNAAGDEALRRIAGILSKSESVVAARVGGGEFALILNDGEVKTLLKAVQAEAGVPLDGVALTREPDETPDQWLGRAECRRAPAPSPDARKIEVATTPTIDAERVRILYQPIVPLHGHPLDQYDVVLKAGDAIVEDAARIPAMVDQKVLAKVTKAIAEIGRDGRKTRFFVRPGVEFMSDQETVARLRQTLGGDPKTVVFEISESILARFPEETSAFIRTLRRQEFSVAIDGFGNTIGNIKMLSQQGVDFAKIDPALVHNMSPDSLNHMILCQIIAVAKKLNKQTIVTGVEGADTLSLLWQIEIDYVQGFFQEPQDEPNYDFGSEVVSTDVSHSWRPA
ncbi:MAG: EAL domain-containing protein [Acidiferrobacteraceae bacterium]